MGRRVVRRHTLERGFTKIIEAAVDLDGLRDADALKDLLKGAGPQIEGLMGTGYDLAALSDEVFADAHRAKLDHEAHMMEGALRLSAWAMVQLVIRWTDDPNFQKGLLDAGRSDGSAAVLEAKFEQRTAEWAELEQPELAYAEAAHHALWRLRDQRVERLGLLDYLGVVLCFLDGPPRPFR